MPQSRRQFVRALGAAAVTVSFGGTVLADDKEKLDPEDPVAKSLDYTHQAANSSKRCKTCQLYRGRGNAEWGKCAIFGSKLVNANGWCASWSA